MVNHLDLVEVIWEDITQLSRITSVDDINDIELMTFSTVGCLIFKDKQKIALAGSILNQRDGMYISDDNYRNVLIIPLSNIVKINKLKVVKK